MEDENVNKNVFREFKTNVMISVPPQLFLNKQIKPVDILIYELVVMLSYKKGYCWATTETIQQSLNIGSNATVISSLKKLERLNYIRQEKRVSNGVQRRIVYPVNLVYENVINENRKGLSKPESNEKLLEAIANYNWIEDEN